MLISGNSFMRIVGSPIRLFLMIGMAWLPVLDHASGQVNPFSAYSGGIWIPATDTAWVKTNGTWLRSKSGFRYAAEEHLMTKEDDALLYMDFEGKGLVLRLSGHPVPSYQPPNLGVLEVVIDGISMPAIHPRGTSREIVLARDLPHGLHRVQMHHKGSTSGTGCRIEGFYILNGQTGELAFEINGEENAHLVDVRAVLTHQGKVIRNTLVRNWLNGRCRLACLPPGKDYALRLTASGWIPHTVSGIEITAGAQAVLSPVYLKREPRTRAQGIRFPSMGHPVIRLPGKEFRTRLVIRQNHVESLSLVRQVGPATISREPSLEEDVSAAFYYDREFIVRIPDDMPSGLYDLVATIRTEQGETRTVMSPRSVHVVRSFPGDPVFMTFGHLDTWGQYQAEYLEQLAGIADILAPDMLLVSNEVNAAYVSGALSNVDVPYLINFGNHQFPGHEHWYGETVGAVDFGRVLTVLNFGLYWNQDLSKADALLSARANTRIKVINGFEHNAPVQTFLDKHSVAMIHDGHGPGIKVMEMGATPTKRIGKSSSESFRIVRFQNGRVNSCTYLGREVDPIPFRRGEQAPLRIRYSPANEGRHGKVTGTVFNDLEETFPNCRAVFVMPRTTHFDVDNAQLEHVITSDNGSFSVVSVRFTLPAKDSLKVSVAGR
jgi:hypothetical protein